MNRSETANDDLLWEHSAPQHERAPRPLPLFLELVRQVAQDDPGLARDALAGLRAYQTAPRRKRHEPQPEIARVRGASLRDHGGDGPPVVLIPSLINPPRVLDLDPQVSLTAAIAGMGRRALLMDWGPAAERAELSIAGHIEELLVPLLRTLDGLPALVGYCLGGTMAITAANLAVCERVATLAAPWNFRCYPAEALSAIADMWRHSQAPSASLGAFPMEVLQASFWSLDPHRTVEKFAEFGRLEPRAPEARRFVELEDWANEGEPLPFAAAEELLEDFFAADRPGAGQWQVSGRTVTDALDVPVLNLTAERDRIAPAAAAPAGDTVGIPSGHVGMIVGSARGRLHAALKDFLSPCRSEKPSLSRLLKHP